MRSSCQVMLFPIVLYVLNGMCLISRCNEVPVYMQQGFIDEDIKLPLPLHFPSKTIFLEERDRKNKIFRMDAYFSLFSLARGWIAGHLRERAIVFGSKQV